MTMHPMVPELVPAGVLNLMPKLHILPRRPAAPTQNQNSSCPPRRICNPSRKSFKTMVCSLLGVPLIGVFQQLTARILTMLCLELWTQKISLLPLSAIGSVTGSDRPEAVSRDLLFRPCGSVAISMVMPSSLQWRISYSEHDHADSTGLAWLAQAASQSAGLSREFHDSLRCIYSSNPSPQVLSWRRVVPIDLPPDPGMS